MSHRPRSQYLALIASGCLLACSGSTAPQSGTQQTPSQGTAGVTALPAGGTGTSSSTAGTVASVPPAGTAGTGQVTTPPPPVAGSVASAAGTSGGVAGAAGGAAGTAAAGSSAAAGGGAGSVAGSGAAGAGGAAGMAANTPVSCDGKTLKPGETTRMVMIGGMNRVFIVHVPSSYTGKAPVPLVVDFHPLGATNTFEKGNSGYQAVADREGFIVAWPQGIQNVWNVGPCCTQSRDIDDVGFAKALVADISSQACVDPKRVYADGYSMGGGMSHYLGCHGADVFATVVPSAFDLMEENSPDCKPARPVTVMSFRSTGDPIVPYAGGASNPPTTGYTLPPVHFLGAVGTFKRWAELDGCTGDPVDTGMAGCQTYMQCKDGVEVTLCTKQGGSHDTGDANLGWAMMKKHPMP